MKQKPAIIYEVINKEQVNLTRGMQLETMRTEMIREGAVSGSKWTSLSEKLFQRGQGIYKSFQFHLLPLKTEKERGKNKSMYRCI